MGKLRSAAKGGRSFVKKYLPEDAYHGLAKTKRKLFTLSGVRNKDLISVVIPTFRKNPYIRQAIASVLAQKGQTEFSLEILVCVNGGDSEYAEELAKEYSTQANVSVLSTSECGAAAGRNLGVEAANGTYLTFLDDDDYFTKGYIAELYGEVRKGVDVVCGRLVDLDEDTGIIESDTYINRHLQKSGHLVTNDYVAHVTPFSGVCAKLYRASFLKACEPFDEGIGNTEDVAFWVDNIQRLKKQFVLCRPSSKQAYVRRKTANSRSRPSEEAGYKFYVTDRIAMIERFSQRILEQVPLKVKKFTLKKIDAQTNVMLGYFQGLDEEGRQRARDEISMSTSVFLNKSKFGEKVGIAFCHNFSPYVDASAFAATKRLAQVSELYGSLLQWTVVAAGMHTKSKDKVFDLFFARQQYASLIRLGKKAYFGEAPQEQWGKDAFEATREIDAEVIYSRSLWAGSHVAALLYKQVHPEVVWYAEFSDPLFMGADNRPRPISRVYEGDEAHLNTFYCDLEFEVMSEADHLIFTNQNQLDYMLASNPLLNDEGRTSALDRSLVLKHAALPQCYSRVSPAKYQMDESRINVGYFGTFYKNRSSASMLRLLENPLVDLHVFCPGGEIDLEGDFGERLHVNKTVNHLSFLNLASRMDYLFLSDVNFEGPINPFVPSKLADYLSTGTQVIAEVNPGSVMSTMDDGRIIRIAEVNEQFARSLVKASSRGVE